MKIWIIGRDYPTVSNHMWGSFEFEQAKLLAEYGHNVSYISLTLSFFQRGDPRGFRQFEECGVNVFAWSKLYFPGKMGIYLPNYEDGCWKKLLDKAFTYTGMPEVIHIHYPTMIGSINEIENYRRMGAKLFVTEHWSRVLNNKLKTHEKKRMIYYASNANCYFSVGKPLQDAVRKMVNVTVPMQVMPNMVSPCFSPCSNNNHSNKAFVFIAIGRLSGVKQFDVIIQQFIQQFSENENIKLKIVGSGECWNNLKNIAKGNAQIEFTGALTQADVSKALANADALVSFSRYETFGVPVIEAWACGKPVIVSAQTAVSSYLNSDLGLAVNCDQPDQLGEAMKQMYMNINEYNSDKISTFAESNFSSEVIYKKLCAAYEMY